MVQFNRGRANQSDNTATTAVTLSATASLPTAVILPNGIASAVWTGGGYVYDLEVDMRDVATRQNEEPPIESPQLVWAWGISGSEYDSDRGTHTIPIQQGALKWTLRQSPSFTNSTNSSYVRYDDSQYGRSAFELVRGYIKIYQHGIWTMKLSGYGKFPAENADLIGLDTTHLTFGRGEVLSGYTESMEDSELIGFFSSNQV